MSRRLTFAYTDSTASAPGGSGCDRSIVVAVVLMVVPPFADIAHCANLAATYCPVRWGSRRPCHVSWVLRGCALKCRDEFSGMSAFVNRGGSSPRPGGQRICLAGGHAMIGLRTQGVNGPLPFALQLAGSK